MSAYSISLSEVYIDTNIYESQMSSDTQQHSESNRSVDGISKTILIILWEFELAYRYLRVDFHGAGWDIDLHYL